MGNTQIVTVDARKLSVALSHAFMGMAEVCACIGVSKEEFIEETVKANERTVFPNGNATRNPDEGDAAAVDGAGAADSGVADGQIRNDCQQHLKHATADDISRVLAAKVMDKRIRPADARALLERFGAKSVSTLAPEHYDAVYQEALEL